MRTSLIAAALLALGGTAIAGAATQEKPEDQAKLAKELSGLVPGKPMQCLSQRQGNMGLTAVGDTLLYRVSPSLVYVNKTTGGCQNVARRDILVTRSFTGGLCRGDIAQTVDVVARMPTGGCALGEFVPYRKP